MADDTSTYHGACYCGAVNITVAGSPAASAICHCRSCRKWHAAPINAWSIWFDNAVTLSGGETVISSISPASERISCAKCGGAIANRKPQHGMTVVYPMTLTGSNFDYKPAYHVFYSERVMDFADDLPKFADLPKPLGGSGETIDEPEATAWIS